MDAAVWVRVALSGVGGQRRQSEMTSALPASEVYPTGQDCRRVLVPYRPAGLAGKSGRPRPEQAPVVAL